MAFNLFSLQVLLRLLALLASLSLLAWSLVQDAGIFTLGWLIALTLLQVWLLFRFLTRTNDELAAFLLALQQQDTMRAYSSGKLEKQFSNLRESFQKISRQFQLIRVDKEKQTRLYQALINQSPVGLFTLDQQGGVPFCNRASLHLFGLEELSRLEQCRNVSDALPGFVDKLRPERPEVFPLSDHKAHTLPVSFTRKDILAGGEALRLISMSPIREELEQHEMASWQKLIRVLTHEMMNSVTPVVTLSKNIEMCLNPLADNPDGEARLGYIHDALHSAAMIGERSQGLMEFVSTYRSLTLLPDPKPSQVMLLPFLEKQTGVFLAEARDRELELKANAVPEDLTGFFDQGLMAQAVINLIKNAIEATTGTSGARISCSAGKDNDRLFIRVSDNGMGIPEDRMDSVFVPFFTTKEGGSGIGLSLCRQIMAMHKGSIEADSEPGKGSTFTLWFT